MGSAACEGGSVVERAPPYRRVPGSNPAVWIPFVSFLFLFFMLLNLLVTQQTCINGLCMILIGWEMPQKRAMKLRLRKGPIIAPHNGSHKRGIIPHKKGWNRALQEINVITQKGDLLLRLLWGTFNCASLLCVYSRLCCHRMGARHVCWWCIQNVHRRCSSGRSRVPHRIEYEIFYQI